MADSDEEPLVLPKNHKSAANSVKTEPAVKKEDGAKAPVKTHAKVKAEPAAAKKTGPADAKAKADSAKPTANGKAAAKSVKEEGAKAQREKKEFTMPGQTREAPPETDSLRKFYTSLLEQIPDSEMAKKWCLQHGLLPRADAEKLAAVLKKTKATGVKSPAKPAAKPADKGAAAKARRPAEKAPAAKKQRQAASPPRSKKPAKYSDEEGGDSSSEEEEESDEDDKPLVAKVKAKPAAAPATKPAAAPAAKPAAKPAAAAKKQDKPLATYSDDDDDDDDLPLSKRAK